MSEQIRPLTISLHALGGQGGGVLADWMAAVAREAGWLAQSTSVPGVAQRTGATVYYLEFFPLAEVKDRQPVFALMPTPGDVDLVVAAELMEAGRAINRGLVSDRTTLIASTNRIYAISEKSGMGDGRLDGAPILESASSAAEKVIAFDMEEAAAKTRSVISAVLLGAIAGCGRLPFNRETYEAVIVASGIAVDTNLAGFAAGFDGAQRISIASPSLPRATIDMIERGVERLRDYQDSAYAEFFRKRIERFESADKTGVLTSELARYLALWMSYEDTVRVADLKVRSARFARVRAEVGAKDGQIVHMTEYLHPRLQEICDMLPAWLGRFILNKRSLRNLIERAFARGRHVTTSKLGGFLLLYGIASLRRFRRGSLRYSHENAKIEAWLDRIEASLPQGIDHAMEVVRCQRLIKGYGDTYDRGWASFSTLMAIADEVDAPTLRRLREAALADDRGQALAQELALLQSSPEAVRRQPALA